MTKLLAMIVCAALIGVDQWLKHWAVLNLSGQQSVTVIPGLFRLTYVENRGVAFGLLQEKTSFITLAVCIVLVCALYLLLSGRLRDRFLEWTVVLIIAGGAGNLIDRVARGFVVDYLDFSALFGFPIFNFADCCVVVGTILLFIYLLLQEKKEKRREAEKTSSSKG